MKKNVMVHSDGSFPRFRKNTRMKTKTIAGILFAILLVSTVIYGLRSSSTQSVRNLNTGLSYSTIQEAIDAPHTLDGHTIIVGAETYRENVDVNKSLTIMGAGTASTIIDPPARENTIDIVVDHVNITGFTIVSPSTTDGAAVFLDNVNNCRVWDNAITGGGFGITLQTSDYNEVSENIIRSLPSNGITITDSSDQNRITKNYLSQCHYGIIIFNGSSNNVISENLIESSDLCGIRANWLDTAGLEPVVGNDITNNFLRDNNEGILLDSPSDSNFVYDNVISQNRIGIRLRQSYNNIVTHNTVISSRFRGISIESSTGNLIYDNFLYNPVNAWDDGVNSWNTAKQTGPNRVEGPYLGGNYWSDYTGSDVDNDGLGDTAYNIPGGANGDNLPLIRQPPLIEVSALSYDSKTEKGEIRFEINPRTLYASVFEVGETKFTHLQLQPKSYKQPSDPHITWTSDPGKPKIPVLKLQVAIPPGMDNSIKIDVEKMERVGTIKDVLVIPVETYEDPREPPKYVMEEKVYTSTQLYPAEWFTELRLEFLSGVEMVSVKLHPVRYNPASREVHFYEISGKIRLEGRYPDGPPRETIPLEPTLESLLINYGESRWWPAYRIPFDPTLTANIDSALFMDNYVRYPILIISADDFSNQLDKPADQLALHKSGRNYYPEGTKVATVDDIIHIQGMRGDIPNRIRTFIQHMHENHKTEYVILFGDVYTIGDYYAGTDSSKQESINLGSDEDHRYYAQSIKPNANAKGVITAALLLSRVSQPNYEIVVELRDDLPPDGSRLAAFTIEQPEVATGKTWVHKHFEHVDLDPTQTYYLVVYTTGINSGRYYKLWTYDDYEDTGVFYTYTYSSGTWVECTATDMVFRSQLYTGFSVPARYAKVHLTHDLYDEFAQPSDFYYACLDGTWNGNYNDIYGEINDDQWPADPLDLRPEASVGRLPAETITDADTMVGKIKEYEQEACHLWRGSVIYCESWKEYSSKLCSDANTGDTSVQVCNKDGLGWSFKPGDTIVIISSSNCEIRTISLISGAAAPYTLVFTEILINSYHIANGAKVIKDQDFRPFTCKENDFCPLFEQPWCWTCTKAWDHCQCKYFPRRDVFGYVFNNGIDAVQLSAHGNPGRCGSVRCDYVSNSLVDTPGFPVVFALSCSTNYYDGPSDCLGETFVKEGKASSYVGCSRVGWGWGCDDPFWNLDHEFWDSYVSKYWRTGLALNDAKATVAALDIDILHHIFGLELLGDPETWHGRGWGMCPICMGPNITLESQSWYFLDQSILFTLRNNSHIPTHMRNEAPWVFLDSKKSRIYSPFDNPLILQKTLTVQPREEISWEWDLTLKDGTQITQPGRYYLEVYTLDGTLKTPIWIYRKDENWQSSAPHYLHGEPITFRMINPANSALLITKVEILQDDSLISTIYEGEYIISPNDYKDFEWSQLCQTAHLPSTGEYQARITTIQDAVVKTFTTAFSIDARPPFTSTTATSITFPFIALPAPFDFTLGASPSQIDINQGESTSFTVNLSLVGGASEKINLSLAGLPEGADYTFTPLSGDPPFTSTLKITTTEDIEIGEYTLTIAGGDGWITRSTSVKLIVKGKPKLCIIATTVYGSELASEVQFLREFRDQIVLSTFAGSQFMRGFNAWYYSFSPRVAEVIASCLALKVATKTALYPLIGILRLSTVVYQQFALNSEAGVVVAGIVASFLIGIVYFSPAVIVVLILMKRFRKVILKTNHLGLFMILWLLTVTLLFLGEILISPELVLFATFSLVLTTLTLSASSTAMMVMKFFP
ncbi:MAG: hypothetical protein AYK19_12995 [Theionarchaea archaeon DG-70-1]|nr:MAG: hypothetical protein AYK19_12995 [Theionarchaea archaeon DG-70-1]